MQLLLCLVLFLFSFVVGSCLLCSGSSFLVGCGSIVIDDTEDVGVSNMVFGCGMLLGKVYTIVFHDDFSFLSLLGCCCAFGSLLDFII